MSTSTKEQWSAHTKHIDIKIHHVREKIDDTKILLSNIYTENQPLDILTKIKKSTSTCCMREDVALE